MTNDKNKTLKIWEVNLIRKEETGELPIAANSEYEAYQIAEDLANSGDILWREIDREEECYLINEKPEYEDLDNAINDIPEKVKQEYDF